MATPATTHCSEGSHSIYIYHLLGLLTQPQYSCMKCDLLCEKIISSNARAPAEIPASSSRETRKCRKDAP